MNLGSHSKKVLSKQINKINATVSINIFDSYDRVMTTLNEIVKPTNYNDIDEANLNKHFRVD